MPKYSNFDITVRREAVLRIVNELKKKGITINRYTVHQSVVNAGFDVDESTVYRDLVAINRENTWIRDLAESNYSQYQESIHETLNWIEVEAKKQYKKKWTMSKRVSKQVHAKDEGIIDLIEQTVTAELAAPKAAFLKIIAEVQDLKIKHTNGENINISAALITQEFQDIKKKYAGLGVDLGSPVNIIELAQSQKKAS